MLRRLFGRSEPEDRKNRASEEDEISSQPSSEGDTLPDKQGNDLAPDKEAKKVRGPDDIPTEPVVSVNEEITTQLPLQRDDLEKREELNQTLDGRLAAAGKTSVGRQRDHNEDAFFLVTYSPKDYQKYFNFGLYIVADGMGGHLNGEVASQATVNSVSNDVITQIFDPMVAGKRFQDEGEIHELLQRATENAHKSIREQAPGGGTTMTTILITDNLMTIAHIGDSRAYLINPGGSSEILTRDHSFVKKLIELGHITAEEAAVHPQRNVLYRALGQGDTYDADISTTLLPPKGHLLVCSDGLWGVIPESEIVRIVNSNLPLDKKCDQLIETANKAGGPDNITSIIVRLPDTD